MQEMSSASRLALKALRACQHGDLDTGVDGYRQALTAAGGHNLPVGLHVALLSGSGHTRAASAIREAGILRGCDLSSCGWARNGNPAAATAEYRELLANGIGTPCMVGRYLNALSLIGDAESLARVAAPEILFALAGLSKSLLPRLKDIASALIDAPTRQFEVSRRSIREMDRVPDTHRSRDVHLMALHAEVKTLISAHFARIATAGHFTAQWLPREFDLRSWGVISSGTGGYNTPHTHGGCWAVAVAYIDTSGTVTTVPQEGLLRVGAGVDGDARCAGWPDFTVAPTPGKVVIMPGFYTHWTVPMRNGGTRISIAFNVIPRLPVGHPNAPLCELAGEHGYDA